MKKKWLSIFALVFCVALMFTGCATVSKVKDENGKSIYFEEAVSFGGHVAQIGDYIYYGNGYVSTTDEEFNYNEASKVGYLSRIDVSKSLTFGEDVKNVNKPHTSPNEIERVLKNKLVGYENQNMYALGDYLYFTSANVHKTDEMKNDYSQISLFRIKFDGDGIEEIATFKNDSKSSISLQKGSDGEYYFVAVAPAEEDYSIYSVKVGKSVGKVQTLAEKVKTAVVADENSTLRNVIYTVEAEKTQTTISVKAVDFATGDDETLDGGVAGSSTNLIDRVGDRVFYSYKNPDNKVEEVYSKEINQTNTNFSPTEKFYNATSLAMVESAYNGYIVKTTGGALVYKTLNGEEKNLLSASQYTDYLFTRGDYAYVSNTSEISRVSLVDKTVETIVSGVTMISGECGYADGYVYFYAKLGELELEEEEGEESEESEKDENYYMYRSDMLGNIQLIGKTIEK